MSKIKYWNQFDGELECDIKKEKIDKARLRTCLLESKRAMNAALPLLLNRSPKVARDLTTAIKSIERELK